MSTFPPPFQIVMVQVRKTAELAGALTSLRQRAEERGLVLSSLVPSDQWIFHMTVAYCSGLSAPVWQELARFVETFQAAPERCVTSEAEVVAFDDGREYSGGVFSLDATEAGPQ